MKKLAVLFLFIMAFALFSANAQSYSTVYGPGIHMDALANTQIGGTDCGCSGYRRTSFRFKANTSANLNSVRLSFPNRAGYFAGSPTVKIELQSDDGTGNHNPSGTVIATLYSGSGTMPSTWMTFSFSTPPALVKGNYYHIVATNTSADPVNNYLSFDGYYQVTPDSSPRQPKYPDDSWAIEYKDSAGGAWVVRSDSTNTPFMQLNYADGTIDGTGYYEVIGYPMPNGTYAKHVSGNNKIREQFTPSQFNVPVSSVSVHIAKVTGTDPLTVRLEKSDGTLIEQGTIAGSTFTSTTYGNWGTYTFSQIYTLTQGTTYNLVLSAPGTSDYQMAGIRDGGASAGGTGYAGKDGSAVFGDGFAQASSDGGSTWANWSSSGNTANNDGDLQFYFTKTPSVPAGSGTDQRGTLTYVRKATTDPSTCDASGGGIFYDPNSKHLKVCSSTDKFLQVANVVGTVQVGLTFGSISANACLDQSFTLTGVRDTDAVDVSAPSFVTNGFVMGYVPTSDTVTIRYCAFTSGTIPYTLFKVVVLR